MAYPIFDKTTIRSTMSTKNSQGFTIVEALVVVAIGSIIMAMAIPSYRTFVMNNQMVADINYFNSALQFARSQAIRDQTNVRVCASNDMSTCSSNNTWENGWVICSASQCGTQNLKVGEDISNHSEAKLRSSNFTNNGIIEFTTDGTLTNNDSRGTFVLCDSRGNRYAKAIIVNAVGRTQKAFDQNGNDIVDDHNGNNVICP